MKRIHMIWITLTIIEIHSLMTSVKAFHNGQTIKFEEAADYNFLFALLKTDAGSKMFKYKCTVTAISNNKFITAAHCFNDYWERDLIKESQETFYIYPAKHRMDLKNFKRILKESTPINIINDVKKHSKYVEGTVCPEYDLVTIKIKNTTLIQGSVSLCSGFHAKGQAISLINREQNTIEPHIMNYGIFEVEQDPNRCETNIRNNDTQFCTTSRNSYSTEDGDSGAPLLAKSTPAKCLMGVVSCGKRKFTIFSRPTVNDIWEKLFLSDTNITTEVNETKVKVKTINETINTTFDTSLYYHITIIVIYILCCIFILFFIFPKSDAPQTPLLELTIRDLTVRELVETLGN